MAPLLTLDKTSAWTLATGSATTPDSIFHLFVLAIRGLSTREEAAKARLQDAQKKVSSATEELTQEPGSCSVHSHSKRLETLRILATFHKISANSLRFVCLRASGHKSTPQEPLTPESAATWMKAKPGCFMKGAERLSAVVRRWGVSFFAVQL